MGCAPARRAAPGHRLGICSALKHAFPGGRGGRIVVGYASEADTWTLTVRDDGVGMPPEAAEAKAGLGSGILTALATQLGAAIVVSDASPGTAVSISHIVSNSSEVRPELLAV